jgi:Uma2 family endonuclease
MTSRKAGRENVSMSIATSSPQTMADLLDRLGVGPERVLLQPPPGTATEEDLIRCPRLCELIDGVLVEKAMGFYESRLAAVLIMYLETYLTQNPLGIILDGSGMVRVRPEQVRLPDVSFFSWDHFPGKLLPAHEQILDMTPDLAVEILSPSNTKKEMRRKRREYFNGGCKLYWEMDPEDKIVRVYTSVRRFTEVGEDGNLSGGDVLPGFTLSVREWLERAGKRG